MRLALKSFIFATVAVFVTGAEEVVVKTSKNASLGVPQHGHAQVPPLSTVSYGGFRRITLSGRGRVLSKVASETGRSVAVRYTLNLNNRE